MSDCRIGACANPHAVSAQVTTSYYDGVIQGYVSGVSWLYARYSAEGRDAWARKMLERYGIKNRCDAERAGCDEHDLDVLSDVWNAMGDAQ